MAKLLMTAKQMQDREAWLKLRNAGIGGSDASVIVGLNKWKSPFKLWLEKTGQAEPEDLGDNEAVYWGNVLEETVAREFSKRTGMRVQRRGLLRHDAYPFLLASVDRIVVGENAGLECKTANGYAAKLWEGDEVPDAYYVQCQHYMLVTGCSHWYIAVLIGGQRFIWKMIPRNEDDIKALFEAEWNFWRDVKEKEMPPVDGTEDCTRALAERFHGGAPAVELPTDAESIFLKLDELTETEAAIKAQIEEQKNQLRVLLGDAEEGTVGDRRVTWKTQAGRVTIDGKRLQAEKPDIYKEYAKQGKPFRVLRLA